jgi:CRP-like cAMP-binding protein
MLDVQVLKTVQFFSDFPSDRLAGIAEKGQIIEMNPSDVIFHMDEPARYLYGVLEGEVRLSLMFREKILKTDIQYEEAKRTREEVIEREIEVETVRAGKVFGWSSFTSRGRWTSTARCIRPGRIFSLPTDTMKDHLEKDPQMGYQIMSRLHEVVSARLLHRTAKLIEAWGSAFEVGSL